MCICFNLPVQRSVPDPFWLSLLNYKITSEWQEWTWANTLNGTVEAEYQLNLMSPGSLYHHREHACFCSQPFIDLCPWAPVKFCEYLLLYPLSIISRIFWSTSCKRVEAKVYWISSRLWFLGFMLKDDQAVSIFKSILVRHFYLVPNSVVEEWFAIVNPQLLFWGYTTQNDRYSPDSQIQSIWWFLILLKHFSAV